MILVTNSSVACPADVISFTCTLPGNFLFWTLTPPGGAINTDAIFRILSLQSQVGVSIPTGREGFMFEAILTNRSANSTTSILTTVTDAILLEGTTIMCTGEAFSATETLTITIAGKFSD